nr:hypothetical protein CFP56_21735 [Quercus suber]
MNVPSLSVDELFAKLKAHDPGLQRHLQQRWDDFKASQDPPSRPHTPFSGPFRSAPFLEEVRHPSVSSPSEKQNVPLTNTELVGTWDITAPLLRPGHSVSDHVQWVRQYDWSRTSLGPMSSWSRPLRQAVNHVLADPRAAVLCSASEAPPIGTRYAQGGSLARACDKADATGEASSGDRGAFFVTRAGFLEEIYADDVTGQVVYQRQMETLLRLDKQTAEDTNVKQFWGNVLKALEPNKHEVPFAVLYSATQHSYDGISDSSSHDDRWSMRSSSSALDDRTWILEGTIGIPSDSVLLPTQLDVSLAVELFSPHFEECLATSRVHLMTSKDGTLRNKLQNVARSRAYQDQCTAAVLCPIGSAHRSARSGFLVLGINPRREYESNYQQFVRLLVRQTVTSLASVGVHEDEARQSKRAAELADIEKHQLSQKLALTEMEVQQNEQRFRQVGEHMPVAMYEAAANGDIPRQNNTQ